jgi:hypothetical protein
MLKHHLRSYGKYTAWALGKSAELVHSAAVRQGPLSSHVSRSVAAPASASVIARGDKPMHAERLMPLKVAPYVQDVDPAPSAR